MKHWSGVISVVLLVVMTGMLEASSSFTEPVLVDTVNSSRHWKMVYTNEVPLSWNWESSNAVKATLAIDGMSGLITTNFTVATSNWVWKVSATDVPSVEDVYELTISFYDSGDVLLNAMTSSLAVVKGSFGEATVDAVPDSSDWTRVQNDVVIPYDTAWGTGGENTGLPQIIIAKVDGIAETNTFADSSGYMGWKLRNSIWEYGTFDLSLTVEGLEDEWTAVLMRLLEGTIISVQ